MNVGGVPGGQGSRQHGRYQGDGSGEGKDAPIEREAQGRLDKTGPGKAEKCCAGPPSEGEAAGCTEASEQQAFVERRSNQIPRTSTERGADGGLVAALRRFREREAGEIQAGNGKDGGNKREQDTQREGEACAEVRRTVGGRFESDVAGEEAGAFGSFIARRPSGCQNVRPRGEQSSVGLLGREPRLQTAVEIHPELSRFAGLSRAGSEDGNRDINGAVDDQAVIIVRLDADNGERVRFDADCLAEDGRVAAEPGAPSRKLITATELETPARRATSDGSMNRPIKGVRRMAR